MRELVVLRPWANSAKCGRPLDKSRKSPIVSTCEATSRFSACSNCALLSASRWSRRFMARNHVLEPSVVRRILFQMNSTCGSSNSGTVLHQEPSGNQWMLRRYRQPECVLDEDRLDMSSLCLCLSLHLTSSLASSHHDVFLRCASSTFLDHAVPSSLLFHKFLCTFQVWM